MTLPTREQRLERLLDGPVDVAIVGGGITGAGIALDLALRGLRVAVVEKNDWASATSGASSRLVHGGLRYLEQFEFSLVRDSCIERARLLRNAAGLVWPETFLFPLRRGDRVGPVKLALGLGLYTALSVPHALGIPRILGRAETQRRLPGIDREGLRAGGSYLDGSTDDARLTLAVVQSALRAGAIALSRVEAVAVEGGRSGCSLRLRDGVDGGEHTLEAARVVLAGGPFTEALRGVAGLGGSWISPTRGSHIVVPRHRLPTDGAVILSSAVDGRVMFLIPWPRYTIVGTTDLDAPADAPVHASREEVQYLLDSANALVPAAGLTEADVVSTWAGLRPLLTAPSTSPSARSREERVELEQSIYTIAGGKLTGYRSMAEKLCAELVEDLGRGRPGRASLWPTRPPPSRSPGSGATPAGSRRSDERARRTTDSSPWTRRRCWARSTGPSGKRTAWASRIFFCGARTSGTRLGRTTPRSSNALLGAWLPLSAGTTTCAYAGLRSCEAPSAVPESGLDCSPGGPMADNPTRAGSMRLPTSHGSPVAGSHHVDSAPLDHRRRGAALYR